MATASAKRVIGRPFQKGDDPRRNRAGRPKALLTAAIAEALTDADAKKIIGVVIEQAKAGDLQAVGMLWDRLEGKAIGRNENGQPGDFEIDLSDVDATALKAALKRVK